MGLVVASVGFAIGGLVVAAVVAVVVVTTGVVGVVMGSTITATDLVPFLFLVVVSVVTGWYAVGVFFDLDVVVDASVGGVGDDVALVAKVPNGDGIIVGRVVGTTNVDDSVDKPVWKRRCCCGCCLRDDDVALLLVVLLLW